MHMLEQINPHLYVEVLRKQGEVWDDLFAAIADAWSRRSKLRRVPRLRVSIEDVLADLAYGRD